MCSLYLAIQTPSLIYILSQEVATMVEWQVMKSVAQNLSRKALADFFCHNGGSACALVLYQVTGSRRGSL